MKKSYPTSPFGFLIVGTIFGAACGQWLASPGADQQFHRQEARQATIRELPFMVTFSIAGAALGAIAESVYGRYKE